MKVTRISPLTHRETTLELDVTPEQLQRIRDRQELIQNIVPQLGPAEREFLLTGYTAEDWDAMFPEEDE